MTLRVTDDVCGTDRILEFAVTTVHSSLVPLDLSAARPGCTVLTFTSCRHLTELPESIAYFKVTLETLDLTRCPKIQRLPIELGEFERLGKLDLECRSLSSLPESLGMCAALEVISLRGCAQLTQLPESVGQLRALRFLTLNSCDMLLQLPESLGQLPALAYFRMDSCHSITQLPRSVGNLAALTEFTARDCFRLTHLGTLGELRAILTLDLHNMQPSSFELGSSGSALGSSGSALDSSGRALDSSGSALDSSKGVLSTLQTLNISAMRELVRLPDALGQLENLSKLCFRFMWHITALPELQLVRLRTLEISLGSLKRLPESLGKLVQLECLELEHCNHLECLPGSLGELAALRQLRLKSCSSLTGLPDSLGELAQLQELLLCECISLTGLPDSVGRLTALQFLDVSGATQLSRLPDSVGGLRSLECLYAELCIGLERVPASLGRLDSLVWINFVKCSALTFPPRQIISRGCQATRDFCRRHDTSFQAFVFVLAANRANMRHLPGEVWGLLGEIYI